MVSGFRKPLWLMLIAWLGLIQSYGQSKPKNYVLKGYIKDLRTFTVVGNIDNLVVDNLLHNRINFKWYTSKAFTTVIEMRNRVFYGEVVKAIPNYAERINTDDYFDLSHVWLNKQSIVIESVLDRAYLKYSKKKWEITIGRQRVNWGINTVWNPNDIFNAYNYFDFDYEERPGSDAIRIEYFTGMAAGFELAGKLSNSIRDAVIAGMYKFNKWNYDFQFLGGISQGDITLGTGWAGNIKQAGFKGEMTWFYPFDTDSIKRQDISATVSFDYSFKNSLYVLGSFLYNSSGSNDADIELLSFNITAKTLMPFKYTLFLMATYPFSPIVNGSMAVMYSPIVQATFINPGVTLNIAQNWDLDFIAQLFFNYTNRNYKIAGEFFYTRLKWSF
jgi:hypothetical protein